MTATGPARRVQQAALMFQHPVYSRGGDLEGFIATDRMRQILVLMDPGHPDAATFADLPEGDAVEVDLIAVEANGDPLRGTQPLYQLHAVRSIAGHRADAEQTTQLPSRFAGAVVHLNYARNGETDGVVLESGDFVHLGPRGMAALRLKVGDHVIAEGKARPMRFGGYVVEAERVNGKAVP
jgi:hypothetical protein